MGKALTAPANRHLRVFAFDPSLDAQVETAVMNRVVLNVPWEENLEPGPVGEYLEVVDYDPASGCYYAPVDLGHEYLLAEDGLDPSEANPQFHQQMVYAVAMTTIHNFEKALGRVVLWSPREGNRDRDRFVERLRIYPHALRGANAYYSPHKKALLFGYFPAVSTRPGRHMPRGMVFTCLSHDVIAHETTHALLDGMHRRFLEPSNPDVLAFHEAFADIVALFQHFSFAQVLRQQIARTRGDLSRQSFLGQLAQQFGEATGRYGALRDALGRVNPETEVWEPLQPDPTELDRLVEPHARGSILVAAVFDAFITIYKSRVADLLRIATSGSGILPEGEIHPDLVNRLASEAAKAAQHVLTMCIRALDYCPPVDITFGEYLRALITADFELVRDDDLHYRIAFVEAFRRRGIYPRDLRTLSVDSLRWQPPSGVTSWKGAGMEKMGRKVRQWNLSTRRRDVFDHVEAMRKELEELIPHPRFRAVAHEFGLAPEESANPANPDDPVNRRPAIQVIEIRPARRVGPDGQSLTDLVIGITQRRWVPFDSAAERPLAGGRDGFWFQGGSTLVIDLETGAIRYAIRKDVTRPGRCDRQREFLTHGTVPSLQATYFGSLEHDETGEPFAFLHGPTGTEEAYA